jgi:hypothetical protein
LRGALVGADDSPTVVSAVGAAVAASAVGAGLGACVSTAAVLAKQGSVLPLSEHSAVA